MSLQKEKVLSPPPLEISFESKYFPPAGDNEPSKIKGAKSTPT